MAEGGEVVGEVPFLEDVPFDVGFEIGKSAGDESNGANDGSIGLEPSANVNQTTEAPPVKLEEKQRVKEEEGGEGADADDLSFDESEDILKPDETLESLLLKVGVKRRKVEQRRQRKQAAGKKKIEKVLDKRQRAYKGTDDSAPTQLLVEGVWLKADEVEPTQRTRYIAQSKARYIKGRHCWGWLFQGQCQKGLECAYVHVKQGELAEIVRKRHPGPDAIREGTTKTSYYDGKKGKGKKGKRKRGRNRSSDESESESGSESSEGSQSSRDEKRRKRRKRRRHSSSEESGSSSE